MQEDRSCPCANDGEDVLTPDEEDTITEGVVLHAVLAAYPELSNRDELVREIAGDPEDFGQRDAIRRAVRDLTRVGLLHCPSGVVMPSRAALRFDRLTSH